MCTFFFFGIVTFVTSMSLGNDKLVTPFSPGRTASLSERPAPQGMLPPTPSKSPRKAPPPIPPKPQLAAFVPAEDVPSDFLKDFAVKQAENTVRHRRSSCAIRKRPTHASHDQAYNKKKELIQKQKEDLEKEIMELKQQKSTLIKQSASQKTKNAGVSELCTILNLNFKEETTKVSVLMDEKKELERECKEKIELLQVFLHLYSIYFLFY